MPRPLGFAALFGIGALLAAPLVLALTVTEIYALTVIAFIVLAPGAFFVLKGT